MGYALPAAIGASAACPEKAVICVTGDGRSKATFTSCRFSVITASI